MDTSALIAILAGEPEQDAMLAAITAAGGARMSAASYLEAAVVVDALGDPVKSRRVDELLEALQIEVAAVTPDQARLARAAYRDFGKGSGHAAGLNFGDVFAYALAAATTEPLLYKGDDFAQTDVASALDSPRG